MDIKLGDSLTVQYTNNYARTFEAECIPNEAVDRICECVGLSGKNITLRFPGKVQMRDGTMVDELTIPIDHRRYRLQKETILEERDYPVEPLYESYWIVRWGKLVSESFLKSGLSSDGVAWTGLEEAIKREGLRAPVLVHRDGTLRGGSHRVLVYKRLGRAKIPAYVTDTVGGTL